MPDRPPTDDPEITDETVLIRRVPHWAWNFDEKRPKSNAFHKRQTDKGLSMYVAGEADLEEILHEPAGAGAVSLRVRDLRRLGFGVLRVPGDGPQGHVEVYGNFTKKNCKQLRVLAEVIRSAERPDSTSGGSR